MVKTHQVVFTIVLVHVQHSPIIILALSKSEQGLCNQFCRFLPQNEAARAAHENSYAIGTIAEYRHDLGFI